MVNLTRKRTKPSIHSFHITGNRDKFIKDTVEVPFKPLAKNKTGRPRSIVPTFNHDNKYYTLAFRLPSAECDPDDQARREHERRVMQAQLQIEDIMYPKPRSRQKYCGVCKDYYQDYKEHVESDSHITSLKKSPYQRLIKEAAEQMNEQMSDRRYEDQKTFESMSEDQLFKCLSIETITEGAAHKRNAEELMVE